MGYLTEVVSCAILFFIEERVEQGEMKMFGMNNGQVFQAASGAELYSDGVRYEEDDSSLSFEDFYFVNGGSAGYILTSPSGQKFSVKVGDKPFVDTRSYFEARGILLSQL